MSRTENALASRSYKVGIPKVSNHVRRDALLARLDECHRTATITWLVGLPGSGKTSLVSRWIEDLDVPVMGYRLDSDDSDGAAWIDAVKVHVSERGELPMWSPENQVELADFARPFFSALARSPLTLVIDDAHRVSDDAALFQLLASMHEVAGDSLRAVVVSRRAPPSGIARGTLGGWLAVVDDLRLSAAESLAIARAAAGTRFTPRDEAAIAGADGWLAHVLALSRGRSAVVNLAGDPSASVGDFLAVELVASVPRDHRAALRQLAELPAIPDDTSGRWITREVRLLLVTLAGQRYFVDFTHGQFRLHDLLRDALLRINQIEETTDSLARVRMQLADWVGEPMPEVAMQLRVAAIDTAGALALISKYGASWLARGLHASVIGWLSALPEPADTGARGALHFGRRKLCCRSSPNVRVRFSRRAVRLRSNSVTVTSPTTRGAVKSRAT